MPFGNSSHLRGVMTSHIPVSWLLIKRVNTEDEKTAACLLCMLRLYMIFERLLLSFARVLSGCVCVCVCVCVYKNHAKVFK
jgi:hypothetical protein